MSNTSNYINEYKKVIIQIFEMVEYYRSEGKPEKLDYNINNFNLEDNIIVIYEAIEFFENYILNFNTYIYDILSQEIFLKLLKTKKINGIDIILENKLNEIKNNIKNKEITSKVEYIITNSYKINSIKKLKELIELLKSLKIKNTQELDDLYFILYKLEIIKKNKYTIEDINDIIKFVNKFNINKKDKLKEELKEMITDKKNIDYINKKYQIIIDIIKKNSLLDKIIDYLDKKNNLKN